MGMDIYIQEEVWFAKLSLYNLKPMCSHVACVIFSTDMDICKCLHKGLISP